MINEFNKKGYLIIKNFYDKKVILNIKKDIFKLSYQLYKKYNKNEKKINFNSDNFDYYLLKAKRKNISEITRSIYDVCKKITGFYEIMGNRKALTLSKKLLGSEEIAILSRGFGMRIDYPGDRYWKARMHQDYSGQLGSPNGLVMYTPLRKVTQALGPVTLYEKSHRQGLFPTIVNMKKVKKKITYDPYYIKDEKKIIKSFKKSYLKIDETDLGIFDFMLLHESSFNRTNKIRWSLVHRIFDYSHSQSIKQNYIGGIMEGNVFNLEEHYNLK